MIAGLKPYRDMKASGDDQLGSIPEHWDTRSLKQICRFAYGDSLPTERRVHGSVPVFGSNGCVGVHSRANTEAPCIVVGRKGSFGKVNFSAEAVYAIDTTFYVDRRLTAAELRWLFFLLGWMRLDAITKDSAIPGLEREDAYRKRAPFPPLPEQRAIARFLDHADRRIRGYIRAKQKLVGLLQEGRTALITHTVTRGLDPNVDTRATRSHVFPSAPRDWTVWKIRHLIQRVRRPIVVEADKEYREIGIRSWGKGIFHKETVQGAMLGEKSVFRIEPGDFVLNIVFAWEGAVSLVSENEKGMIASHRFPTFRPSPDVDIDYLLMVFQSGQGRRLMDVNSPGAAGRNKTLRIGQFLDEEIPLPVLDEQRMIVAAFRDEEQRLTECVTRIRQATDQLKEFRSRLIADVVTGKLDVRAAAAGPPEADRATTEGNANDGVDSQAEEVRPGELREVPI